MGSQPRRGVLPFRRSSIVRLALALLLVSSGCARGSESDLEGTQLIARGSVWRLGLEPGLGTPSPGRTPEFAKPELDDAAWEAAPAPLGFDQDGIRHSVDLGEDSAQVALFLRHAFEVGDPAAFDGLVLELRVDDGARVYLNGTEVARSNLPGGWEIGANTRAVLSVAGEAEDEFVRWGVPVDLLVPGPNLLAVSLHNTRAGSDLLFDAALIAQGPSDRANVLRGPYLQRVTPKEARVRFETSRPVVGIVRYGTEPDALDGEARSKKAVRSHEIVLRELLSGARYAYLVDAAAEEGDAPALTGPGLGGTFRTAPRTGSRAPTRVWVTGDLGTGSKHARAVRDSFARFSAGKPADLWITLGDNAYPSGTPMDWQARLFGIYPQQLATLAFFPSIGNHDAAGVSPQTGKVHYFEALSLPTRGEAGGSASGTEHYYSFDWGNTHFVVLDSDQSDRRAGGPMARWLALDLIHSQADWKVAYLHHAPFSRGTHHDDKEKRSRQMRENFVPLLEKAGVDLVISGHSHAYERSHWLAGPHPEGWHFDPGRVLGEATTGEGIDTYSSKPGTERGTVYVVAGSAGQIGKESPLDHPSMAFSLETHGSVVLDIEGCTLESRFIDIEGAVLDAFAIEKEDRLGTCRGGRPAAAPATP